MIKDPHETAETLRGVVRAPAVVGDRLYMAGVGSGNDHLGIMPSVDLDGGLVGFDGNAKFLVEVAETQEVQSGSGPRRQ